MTPQTKLYLLIFIDSLCLGLLLPVLNTHILTLNGTHTVTGFLGSASALCQLVSKQFTPKFIAIFGNEHTLVLFLAIALITNAVLGLTENYLYVLIVRIIFTFTNHIETLCANILVSNSEDECENKLMTNRINVVSILGMVVGPIIGGLLYLSDDFKIECTFLVAANVVSIGLALDFMRNADLPECLLIPTLTVEKVVKEIVEYFRDIYNSIHALFSFYRPDAIAVSRILVRISQIAFVTKFSLLLKVNFDLPVDYIGYTVAYQNAISFLLNLVIITYKDCLTFTQFNKIVIFITTLLLTNFMFLIVDSPSYTIYLLYYIPFAAALVYLTSLWNIAFASETTPELNKSLQLVDVVFPVIYGKFCDWLVLGAFKIFTMVPLSLADILIILYI